MFFFLNKSKIANFADDNTPHAIENDIMELLKTLESETRGVLNWFRMNEMKPNQGKCHLLVADINHKNYSSKSHIYLENAFLESEDSVTLLGLQIDQNLDFEEHITLILKEANKKLHALMRIKRYLTQDKLRLIMKTFIESQFNYCPLVWMCHSRDLNNRINKLHERALRVVYERKDLTFEEFLRFDEKREMGPVRVHPPGEPERGYPCKGLKNVCKCPPQLFSTSRKRRVSMLNFNFLG